MTLITGLPRSLSSMHFLDTGKCLVFRPWQDGPQLLDALQERPAAAEILGRGKRFLAIVQALKQTNPLLNQESRVNEYVDHSSTLHDKFHRPLVAKSLELTGHLIGATCLRCRWIVRGADISAQPGWRRGLSVMVIEMQGVFGFRNSELIW